MAGYRVSAPTTTLGITAPPLSLALLLKRGRDTIAVRDLVKTSRRIVI